MEAKVREYREEAEAERAHDKVFKREIAALKRKEAAAEARAASAGAGASTVAAASQGDNKAIADRELRAENARLSARMRRQMQAERELGSSGGRGVPAAHAAEATLQQLAAAPASTAIKIPAAVLEKADAMVKHKVTTELAQHYESEINSDTNFIFSGSRADESNGKGAAQLAAGGGSGPGSTPTQLAAASPGFGDLHQMEKQVLSQLMEANQRKAQAAREREAAAKKAAAHKLALKKRWYQEEVRQEDEAKAKVEAKKEAAHKAAEAKAEAAAAAKYAKEHKPVSKMSVQQRALAFVKAFDGGVPSKAGDASLSASQAALAGNMDASL